MIDIQASSKISKHIFLYSCCKSSLCCSLTHYTLFVSFKTWRIIYICNHVSLVTNFHAPQPSVSVTVGGLGTFVFLISTEQEVIWQKSERPRWVNKGASHALPSLGTQIFYHIKGIYMLFSSYGFIPTCENKRRKTNKI